jgi:hypothetical protein
MLTEELREKLMNLLRENPTEALKEIEKDPKILEILLSSDKSTKDSEEKVVKYINMNNQMQSQLAEQAQRLNTTQGLLIGTGLMLLLSLINDSNKK